MLEKPLESIDILLEPLLRPAGDEQDEEILSRLLATQARPVIEGVIRFKLHLHSRHAAEQAEAEDLCQEILRQLLVELQRFRAQPAAHPISDLRALAAIIAHRTCSRWMRCRFPERHALNNRLQYLLTRQRGLALWRNEEKVLVAGLASWQGQKQVAGSERLRALSDDEGILAHLRAIRANIWQADLFDLLVAVFNFLGSPVVFNKLVSVMADLLHISEQRATAAGQDETISEMIAPESDPAWQAEKRIFLQRLWEEVRQLSLHQRAALLLNLKDSSGRGCIALFPATGIASVRQLAEALEIDAEKFAQLWNELPLDDQRIAQLLQMTRQQVINARKAARKRLLRRLKGFI